MTPEHPVPVTDSEAQTGEGWGAVATHFLSTGERNTFARVSWSFFRHPVETILRLTGDTTYRGHLGFLTAWLGAELTLSYVILPKLFGGLFQVPVTTDKSAVLVNEIIQYVGMAILTPIQFYLCRFLGTIPRSPMSYVKLCILSVGYCALLLSLVVSAFWIIGVAATAAGIGVNAVNLANWLLAAGQIAIIAFITASHRRFWGMSWGKAVSASLIIAFLSWGVVYPLLLAAVPALGLDTMLQKIE